MCKDTLMPSRATRSEENRRRPPAAVKCLVISAVWQKEFAPLLNMQQGCGEGGRGGGGKVRSPPAIRLFQCSADAPKLSQVEQSRVKVVRRATFGYAGASSGPRNSRRILKRDSLEVARSPASSTKLLLLLLAAWNPHCAPS